MFYNGSLEQSKIDSWKVQCNILLKLTLPIIESAQLHDIYSINLVTLGTQQIINKQIIEETIVVCNYL